MRKVDKIAAIATVALTGLTVFGVYTQQANIKALEANSVSSTASTIPLGVNLEGLADWSRGMMFVDAMKTARGFGSPDVPWDDSIKTFDENGWATTDFGVVVITDGKNIGGTYALSFTGKADVSGVASALSVKNYQYNPATNTSTADVVVEDKADQIMLAFKNTGGIKNVKLIRPGYAADTKQVFHTPFLQQLKPFGVIRLMDYLNTNSTTVANWEDRRKPTDALQTGDKGGAIEYAIELANLTGKDLWINIPDLATDDYVRQLALLLKAKLNRDRIVYLEYSNEVWNWSFKQATRNQQAAEKEVAAGNSILNADGETNKYYWGWRRVPLKLINISNIFKDIFGQDSINTKIRPVLASQIVWYAMLSEQLSWVQKTFGSPNKFFYAVAGAPYFGPGDRSKLDNQTVDQLFAGIAQDLDNKIDAYVHYYSIARAYNLKNFSYEGGLDTGQGEQSLENKIASSYDPRMTNQIYNYLNTWYGCGGDLFMYFTLSSTYSKWGQWGLTDDITKPSVKTAAIEKLLKTPRSHFECSTLPTRSATGVIGNGTGLKGKYFSDSNLKTLALTRVDPLVNFNWDHWSGVKPTPQLSAEQFSVRWQGKVMPKYSEKYNFHIVSDKGVRLWVNNKLLVDNWQAPSKQENSGTIALKAGQLYDLKMEFSANKGGQVRLLWSSPSQVKAAIPRNQLYPE